MTPNDREPTSRLETQPLRVIVDANTFGRGTWIRPIVASAQRGHIEVYWSPPIIAETTRLLTWFWLRGHGGEPPQLVWRRCSQAAHVWFDTMSSVFRVVEDAPPHEPLWTETPRDPHDRPIWTAAVRARAQVIVTANLRDGPPLADDGFRSWDNILYVAPDDFVALLDWWAATPNDDPQSGDEASAARAGGPDKALANAPPPRVQLLLRAIEARTSADDPPPAPTH